MKKPLICIMIIIVSSAFLLFSQSATLYNYEGEFVSVYSEVSETDAQDLAYKLDAYMDLFDSYLHLDLSTLDTKMRVKVFQDKTGFDTYLQKLIGETKSSFVFLQYSDLEKSELICYHQDDQDNYNRAIIHHSFIQYLKAFIDNPPLWMQKGFAVYFEKIEYNDENGEVDFIPNLSWVNTLKQYISSDTGLIPITSLLSMDVDTANTQIELFYAQSWGLINFLINSTDPVYNRIIWDSVTSLVGDNDQSTNEQNVLYKAFIWVSKDKFVTDFEAFCLNVKTFPDLVEDGIAYFSNEDYSKAKSSFEKAIELRDSHAVPYYYLGLISYYEKDFTEAEYYYNISLEKGGEEALTYYALGVNAYSDQRFEDSLSFLNLTYEKDPSGYGVKAQDLIERINSGSETEEVDDSIDDETSAEATGA